MSRVVARHFGTMAALRAAYVERGDINAAVELLEREAVRMGAESLIDIVKQLEATALQSRRE